MRSALPALTLAAELCAYRSDTIRSTAQRFRRKLDMQDGFGWQIPNSDLSDLLVRCSSESVFYPAMQRLCGLIATGAFGRILEANTGFLHSSDLDPGKPINWKRMIEFNGEYGVMGDLGMHACHVPFRAGWTPRNVRAVLSNLVRQRPDGRGGMVACETWDNATLFCEARDPASAVRAPPIDQVSQARNITRSTPARRSQKRRRLGREGPRRPLHSCAARCRGCRCA